MNGFIFVGAVLLALNLFSFALMGWDKRCAKKSAWRVPERNLFLSAICFGALGGVLGMHVFHHKTKHWYFRIFFPALLVVQFALIALAARFLG